MLLAIDVSNTHTKLGVYDRETLVRHWRVQTLAERTADEYAALLLGLFTASNLAPTAITGTIVSSVVPPINATMEDLCRKFFDHPPLWVGPGTKTGMPILVDNPREVGADRIVNSVAAYERLHCAAIVIGIGISLDALGARTAKLPKVELVRPPRVVGKNTVHSIQSGVVNGYTCL